MVHTHTQQGQTHAHTLYFKLVTSAVTYFYSVMVNHAGYLPSSQWLLIDIVLDVAEQPWKGHLLNDLLRVVHTKVCSGEGKKLIRPLLNTMWLPPPPP